MKQKWRRSGRRSTRTREWRKNRILRRQRRLSLLETRYSRTSWKARGSRNKHRRPKWTLCNSQTKIVFCMEYSNSSSNSLISSNNSNTHLTSSNTCMNNTTDNSNNNINSNTMKLSKHQSSNPTQSKTSKSTNKDIKTTSTTRAPLRLWATLLSRTNYLIRSNTSSNSILTLTPVVHPRQVICSTYQWHR
jgi:hypothetical protein